nr:hypothetical protein CKG001_10480 [Bdellovibrio sp. CKG001]
MSEQNKREIYLTKGKDEVFVQEAAYRIGIDPATLFRWIRKGKVPAKRRVSGLVIKISVVEKVRAAYKAHKNNWEKHCEQFTSAERFVVVPAMLNANAPAPILTSHVESKTEPMAVNVVVAKSFTPKQRELAQMVRRLQDLQEPELAARVSLRVVMGLEV